MNVCDGLQNESFLCACGPGDWSIGDYAAVLRKNCMRCQVQNVAVSKCGCATGTHMTDCAAGSSCVLAWGGADEKCLALCENSDSVKIVSDCACKAPDSAKTQHATQNSLCKVSGEVLHSCSGAVSEACLCGSETCSRGQKCITNACADQTQLCTAGNAFPGTE